jgi:aspartyl-tRNA synthetase
MISELKACIGERVTVAGWIDVLRKLKKMQFIILRDSTACVQAIHERASDTDQTAALIDSLLAESAVIITGNVIENPQVKLGQIEIVIEKIEPVGAAIEPLPLNEGSNLDVRTDWRFLDLRRPSNRLIFQIQTTLEHAMRQFWVENAFIEIHSPKLMGSASETGAELFRLKYFDTVAYLAQSPQFYKQMAMAAGFERVFEIGPVFRANPSFTSRHDTEFTSVDVEISWIDSHHDVMQLEETWLQHVMNVVKERHGEQIAANYQVEVIVPEVPFPRVTMKEAHEILKQCGYEIPGGAIDLDPEGERILARHISEKFNHNFVFVTDYPTSVRPFYHMRHEDNPTLTKSFDLIWKGVEITTGAQREHRYEKLLNQASEKKISATSIQYYLDFFKYGCPPHGGYGFGLTRMLMILLGFKNVREVTYLFRGPNRLSP